MHSTMYVMYVHVYTGGLYMYKQRTTRVRTCTCNSPRSSFWTFLFFELQAFQKTIILFPKKEQPKPLKST